MEVQIKLAAPVSPPIESVTLTLTEDEAVKLAAVCGSRYGPQADERVTLAIYKALDAQGLGYSHPGYRRLRAWTTSVEEG